MATRYNYTGGIVTNGLVLNLDAAKVDSYPGTGTTWYDISGNNNNGTLTNGPTFSGIGKQAAIVFDGTNDYVNCGSGSSVNITGTGLTLASWVYRTSLNTNSNNYRRIIEKASSYPALQYSFVTTPTGSTAGEGKLLFDLYINNSLPPSATGSTQLQLNTWYHAVATYNGAFRTIYLNGAPNGQLATTGDITSTNSNLVLGDYSSGLGTTYDWAGSIATAQIYNQALTQFQVWQNFNTYKSRYGIPDIVTDGLVLNLDAGNPYSYLSGSSGTTWSNTVAVSSSISGTLVNGTTYSNGAMVFDGVDDYVNITRPSQIITSGSITISIWAKWTTTGTTTSTIQALVDNNHSSSPIQGFIIQDRPDLSKKIQWGVYPNTNGATSSFQVGDGTWRHIVGTYESGSTKLYINGSLDGFSTQEPNMSTVQPNITLGKWQFGNSRYLNGTIASTQIYNRALSAAEVSQNFNALRGRYGI